MPAVNLTTVKKRVVSILMANRTSPYSGSVGTGQSTNSRYQSDTEIADAALEADSIICQARISNPGDPYRNTWMTTTADLASGSLIPPTIGALGGVEVKVGSTYTPARFTSSKAEILAMRAHSALYPNAQNWAWIEDGILFHNGDFGRVWRSTFTKSTVCQAPEQDEFAVVALTIASLAKDGSVTPEIYSAAAAYGQWYIESVIKGKDVTLPLVEQIEGQLAA